MSDTQHSPADGGTVIGGWLTIDEFATQIKRGPRTVRRYIDRGLPTVMVGATTYIDPPKARAWFEAGMPPRAASPRRRRAA